MKRTKRIVLALLIMLLTMYSLFSYSLHDAYYNFKDVFTAFALSATAAHINVPRVELEGVTITEGNGVIPSEIKFEDADLLEFRDALKTPSGNNPFTRFISMAVNTVSPLTHSALKSIDALSPNYGDIIINGDIKIESNIDLTVMDLVSIHNMVGLEINSFSSIILSGKSFPDKVELSGQLDISVDQEGKLSLTTTSFYINGEQVQKGSIVYKL